MPGDPDALREVARAWWQIADDSEYARVRIQQLLADETVMQWIGKAATAFRTNAGKLPDQLEKCAASYRLAADAIWWWSGVLETCQGDADRGLAIGRIARDDLNAALLSLASAQDNAASAARYQSNLELPPGAYGHIPSPDPHAVTVAIRRAQYAQDVVTRAQSSVTDAQERLDAAKRLVSDAVSLREQQGRVAAKRIYEAADAGIAPDSFWHKVEDVLDEAWHIAVTVAQVVVIVGGIAALIVGGPIAWAVVAAGAVLLTDAVTKYVQGKDTLWDIGLAALACIPCTEGLTTVGRLSELARSGKLFATGATKLRSAGDALSDAITVVRNGGRAVRSGEAVRTVRTTARELINGGRTIRPDDCGRWDDWAEGADDDIRASPHDVDSISAQLAETPLPNGSIVSREDVSAIKAHIFETEHPTVYQDGEYALKRFDADSRIAEAWYRLQEGASLEADRVLILHELAELTYMSEHPGVLYSEAHEYATRIADWDASSTMAGGR